MYRPGTLHTGEVREFDAARGLGRIAVAVGSTPPSTQGDIPADVWFHCIEIADASRQIEIGTPVAFRLTRRLGVLEAAAVTAVRSTDR